MKPTTAPEKKTRTVLDCIEITPEIVNAWELPIVQRGLITNAKVRALAEELRNDGGVLPGIIILGIIDKHIYLVDGQQRRNAFLMSGLETGYADVCYRWFDNMVDLGKAFHLAQRHLVGLRADDSLRALEPGYPNLQKLRKELPFVGYDKPRRALNTPILSMSVVLRAWGGASQELPSTASSMSSAETAESLTGEETKNLISFMQLCWVAWGRDAEYASLWKSLNLVVCMWLYRRVVLGEQMDPQSRAARLTGEQFLRGMMSVSANATYVDWLVGRSLGDHDRGPCYNRIKTIITNRIKLDTGALIKLPQPPWGGARTGVRPETVGLAAKGTSTR